MRFIIVLGSFLFFLSLHAQNFTDSDEPKKAHLFLNDTLALGESLYLEESLSLEKVQIGENGEEVLHEKASQLAKDPKFQALVDAMIDKNANEHLRNYIGSQIYLMVSYVVILATAIRLDDVVPGFVYDSSSTSSCFSELLSKFYWAAKAPLGLVIGQGITLYELGQIHFASHELNPQNFTDLLQYQKKENLLNIYKNGISGFQYWIPTFLLPTLLNVLFLNMKKDMRVYNAFGASFANSINSYETYKTNLIGAMTCLQFASLLTGFVWLVTNSASNP
jgi:hypothetical protein